MEEEERTEGGWDTDDQTLAAGELLGHVDLVAR